MSATHPESLLTRAEQRIIAIAVPSVAILTRLAIGLLAATYIGHDLRTELVSISITAAMFVASPLAVSAMVRAVATRRRAAEIAVLIGFSVIGALTSCLWRYVVAPPTDLDEVWRFGWVHLWIYAPAVALFLSLTARFIAAIQQHRVAIAEDARRFEAEAESARRARQAIEQQMKPGLVVAALQTIAARLESDPEGAERLLLRLARQQRLLLQKAPAKVSLPPDAAPAPVRADDRAVTAIPSLPVVYPLLVYLTAILAYDLEMSVWWTPHWYCAFMTAASAVCWLFAGPALRRAVRAAVALRLPLAIASASSAIVAASLLVTAAGVWSLYAIEGGPVHALLEHTLTVMAWRNSLPALVIGASSLLTAYSGVMVAARAAAARARNETVLAETRALEDRFHPHFLFNALNSIAAFIREDRGAAARMCLQLSGLVERTMAFAGDRWWAVGKEVDLIAEYLAIQRIRFGERLQIEQWDVPSEVCARLMPRLVLQPLLENIFKHAVASSARPIQAGLTIRKRRRGIEISLWNSIGWNSLAGAAGPLRFGRGLTFVSGRIRDAAGTLAIGREAADGRFTIRCFIPQPL
jgi:two-component system, LytTR family, sensor histidine kinase AlgZ